MRVRAATLHKNGIRGVIALSYPLRVQIPRQQQLSTKQDGVFWIAGRKRALFVRRKGLLD